MTKNIVFATCRAKPGLQAGDAALATALERFGVCVTPAPWNGPLDLFAQADTVVIRSTWDYQKTPEDFALWLDWLGDTVRVFNPPGLMRWNMSKRYLLELEGKGAPLPATRSVDPTAQSIAAAMDMLGLSEAVVKPEIGATGSGLSRVRRRDASELEAAAAKMAAPGFVQALIPEISTAGETSLIFIAGMFSHAVTKRPRSGEILCQSDHGGAVEAAAPPGWAIAEAARILAMLPEAPLYARVDAVLLDGRLQLMEVELIEPELFFTYAPATPNHPGPAELFASALLERL